MKRLFLITFALSALNVHTLFAQNQTKEFVISSPGYKIKNSLYASLEFIDSRMDTTHMGVVQLGMLNSKAKVIPGIPLSVQLRNVFSALTDSSASNGTLAFQLRQFAFAELTTSMSERGYCYLKAVLYTKNNDLFKQIASIDTVVVIKSMDVTNGLFRNGTQLVTDFIAQNLQKAPSNSIEQSYSDLIKIDSIEKRSLPLYNTETYTNGLYYSYKSFKNQKPDKQIAVKMNDDGSVKNVKYYDEIDPNLKINVKPKDIYAIVDKGKIFIATEYGYYPLNKASDNFYFTGQVRVTASAGAIITGGILLGAIGGLLASNANATFVIMIDPTNGGFIRLREVRSSQ